MTGPSSHPLLNFIVRCARGVVMALLACLWWSAPAMAAPKSDFAAVTSRAQAEAFVREGKLVRVLLFPAAFGGEDIPENSCYVPPEAAEALAEAEEAIARFAQVGITDTLDVLPDYRGDSIVPTHIAFHVAMKGEWGRLKLAVNIW